MRQQCFLATLVLFFDPCTSQGGNFPGGSPALGMGGTSVISSDHWSCFNNPAGLGSVRSFTVGTFYESRFLLAGIANKGVLAASPFLKSATIGGSLMEFGNDNYSDKTIAISFSKTFGNAVKAGIRGEWQSVSFKGDYNSGSGVSLSAGMQVRITKQAEVGICLLNPYRSRYSDGNEPLPASFKTGIKWEVSATARSFFEFEKVSGLPFIWRAAAEYDPAPVFVLRAGVSNSYIPVSIGFGFRAGKLSVDCSTGFHKQLGFTPSVSLSWTKQK
jgi:hypothetical protein